MKKSKFTAVLILSTVISLKLHANECSQNISPNITFFPHERTSEHIFNLDTLNCSETSKVQITFEETFKIKLKSIAKDITLTCSDPKLRTPSNFNIKLCDFDLLLKKYFQISEELKSLTDNNSVIMTQSSYPWQRDQDLSIGSWYIDLFAPADLHQNFVKHIVQKSVYEKALIKHLTEYKKYMHSLTQQQNSTTLYRTGLEYAISYLRFNDPLLWSIQLALNSKCLKSELGCEQQRQSFIQSVISDNTSIWKRLAEMKDMILNYTLRPWPEAEDLKNMLQMLSLLINLESYTFKTIPNIEDINKVISNNSNLKNYTLQLKQQTTNTFINTPSGNQNTYASKLHIYRATHSLVQLINLYKLNQSAIDSQLADTQSYNENQAIQSISNRIQAINTFFNSYEEELLNATN